MELTLLDHQIVAFTPLTATCFSLSCRAITSRKDGIFTQRIIHHVFRYYGVISLIGEEKIKEKPCSPSDHISLTAAEIPRLYIWIYYQPGCEKKRNTYDWMCSLITFFFFSTPLPQRASGKTLTMCLCGLDLLGFL